MSRNLKLTLEYDGGPYKGWQRQAGFETVQGTLEGKLSDLCGHPVSLLVAGRTDAGVHALGQVCSFKTQSRLSNRELLRVLNQLLPHSIRALSLENAPAVFHATYHAKAKLYRYVLHNSPSYTVFDRNAYYHVRKPLDLRAMSRAARAFEGRHDFSAFRGILGRVHDPFRRLLKVGVRRRGKRVLLEYYGVSFLHQMVRILSGTLLYVGLGKFAPSDMPDLLASRDRKRTGPTLPPYGLFLVRVDYPKVFPPVKGRRKAPVPADEE